MIAAHTTDAWTRPADKTSFAYGVAVVLGGFAAPLFLWLAGLGVAFGASRIVERTGSRAQAVEAMCRRGLEIFVLAFLFRLQAFIVSPPSTPLKIFRVDILNVMGPAMVGAALVWALGKARARVVTYGLIATAIAMATPVIRATHAIDWLPVWMQWYLRPAGEFTTFTLFPWAGFVFAGGAAGTLLAAAGSGSLERRLHVALAVVGVVLIGGGFIAAEQPTIYRSSSFWTSSPTWFAIRVGVVTIALTLCFIIERLSHATTTTQSPSALRAVVSSWQNPLAKMGRASLFVYWIHVELVYGYASWLWRGRLAFWGAVLAFMSFTVVMYGAIGLRDRVVDAVVRRRTGRSSWRPAPGR